MLIPSLGLAPSHPAPQAGALLLELTRLKRTAGVAPATSSLGSSRSAAELRPRRSACVVSHHVAPEEARVTAEHDHLVDPRRKKREAGLAPATSSLASSRSTTELHPHEWERLESHQRPAACDAAALLTELRARVPNAPQGVAPWSRVSRTRSLARVRGSIPGEGVAPSPDGSEPPVLLLDDPGQGSSELHRDLRFWRAPGSCYLSDPYVPCLEPLPDRAVGNA